MTAPFVYPFKINRDLLSMNALELDETLRTLFSDVAHETPVTLIDDSGKERVFHYDPSEALLSGRGLQAFFSRYESDLLGVQPIDGQTFHIHHLPLLAPLRIEEGRFPDEDIEALTRFSMRIRAGDFESETRSDLHERSRRLALTPGFDQLLSLDVALFTPLGYQINTVRQVVQQMRGRALLCDEVGLGKTVEAGLILMEYLQRGLAQRILILTPPSLVEQWCEELQRKFSLDFIAYDSPAFREHENPWEYYPRIIASIHTAKRHPHAEAILNTSYDLVIVDEAHHVKNRATASWRFVSRLQKRYILLLTATPVQNDLEDLFNLITLLKPGQLETPSEFKRRYIARGDKRTPKNTEDLRRLMADVMVRNRRSDSDVRLPPRHAETISLSPTPAEAALYADVTNWVRRSYRESLEGNRPSGASSLLALKTLQRVVGSSPRAAAATLRNMAENRSSLNGGGQNELDELAREARTIEESAKETALLRLLQGIDGPTLVFTGFRATQERLLERLQEAEMRLWAFHGQMNRAQKETAVRGFRSDGGVLVSTESGGEGRNLQFCNVMINYDLPWNPMRIEQRIGRIHRIGQDRDVYIYNLSAEGTIEAYILDLLAAKINLFELVVGELDLILGNLDEKKEFDDIVMDIWARSRDETDVATELNQFGDQLAAAKARYHETVAYDEALFADAMKAGA